MKIVTPFQPFEFSTVVCLRRRSAQVSADMKDMLIVFSFSPIFSQEHFM